MFKKMRDKGYFEPIGDFLVNHEPNWEKHEKNLENATNKMMRTGVKIDAALGIGEFKGSSIKERRNAFKGFLNSATTKVKKGDIIGVNRSFYDHYGIYINHNQIIHFSSLESDTSFANNRIIETDLNKFLRDSDNFFIMDIGSVEKNVLKFPSLIATIKLPTNVTLSQFKSFFGKMRIYSAEETVERAKSRLGDASYNLITNNCEHFAIWSKTGVSKSYQVEGIMKLVLRIPVKSL